MYLSTLMFFDLRIPHSDALTNKPQRLHRERDLLRSSYDTRPTIAGISTVDSVMFALTLCIDRGMFPGKPVLKLDNNNISVVVTRREVTGKIPRIS